MTEASDYGLPEANVKVHKPTTWQRLQTIISSETIGRGVWRGQAQEDWKLETRLERTFKDHVPMHESRMLQRFVADATQMEPGISAPSSRFDWLALMQHYGAPTRLLDWTTSAYVALYFACCHDPGLPGAVWRIDREWLHRASLVAIKKVDTEIGAHRGDPARVVDFVISKQLPVAIPVLPRRRFPRMIGQAGLFTLVGGPTGKFRDSIKGIASPIDLKLDGIVIEKIVIPAALKEESLLRLRAMNISESSIYPGLEGLARSLPHGDFLDWYFLPGSQS